MVRRLGLLAVLAAALAPVPAALADSGSPNYSSKLISVTPRVKGLTVRVVDGDDAIELRNMTGRTVIVPGYEAEPYLRFLANGRVEVNVNSPAKYLNEERYGGVAVPKQASAKANPKWQLVAQSGSYAWHEHRVHWMSTDQPPRVKASGGGELQKVFDWVVPLTVGDTRVKASGTLWWVPTGQLEHADALIATAVAREARQKRATATQNEAAAAAKASTSGSQAAPAPGAPAQRSPDSGSPLLWGLIAVLGVALAGAVAYALRLRRGDDPARPRGEVW